MPDLPGGAECSIEAELMPLRRGLLRLTGTTVACPDPFGLFRSLRKIPGPQSVLILPRRYAMPAFDLPGSMKYQLGGVSMASSVGESEEFVALREYRPGDPLRRMHRKSFAKLGKPIVKEYQDEFFVRHALVLDTFGGPAEEEIFEEAVSVAASLAYTIQTQDSLLDLMFVGPEAYCFTSGRGVGHIDRVLEVLASVRVCQEKDFGALEDADLLYDRLVDRFALPENRPRALYQRFNLEVLAQADDPAATLPPTAGCGGRHLEGPRRRRPSGPTAIWIRRCRIGGNASRTSAAPPASTPPAMAASSRHWKPGARTSSRTESCMKARDFDNRFETGEGYHPVLEAVWSPKTRPRLYGVSMSTFPSG